MKNEILLLLIQKLHEQRDSLIYEIRSMDYSCDYADEKIKSINESIELIDDELRTYWNECFELDNANDVK